MSCVNLTTFIWQPFAYYLVYAWSIILLVFIHFDWCVLMLFYCFDVTHTHTHRQLAVVKHNSLINRFDDDFTVQFSEFTNVARVDEKRKNIIIMPVQELETFVRTCLECFFHSILTVSNFLCHLKFKPHPLPAPSPIFWRKFCPQIPFIWHAYMHMYTQYTVCAYVHGKTQIHTIRPWYTKNANLPAQPIAESRLHYWQKDI